MRDAPAGTQVVVRAIRLLKSFTPDQPVWTLSELCRACELSKSTGHRLLGALESEGLVVRDSDRGRYRLGPAAVALGVQALRSDHLRTLARPTLERLAKESDETTTLEVMVDDDMLILDEIEGRHLISANANVGTRWPLHATSTGKALLATWPSARRDAFLDRPLLACTPATRIQPEALAHDLEDAKRAGYAIAREELEDGHVAAGAVLLDGRGEPVGALSVGGPSHRIDDQRLEHLGKLVAEHARSLSYEFGWSGDA